MKRLVNKETGELGEIALNTVNGETTICVLEPNMPLCGNSVLGEYDSLDKLCKEWQDEEERGSIRIEIGDRFGEYYYDEKELEPLFNKLPLYMKLKSLGMKFHDLEEFAITPDHGVKKRRFNVFFDIPDKGIQNTTISCIVKDLFEEEEK